MAVAEVLSVFQIAVRRVWQHSFGVRMSMVSVVEAMSSVSSILVGSLVTGCWEVELAAFYFTQGM